MAVKKIESKQLNETLGDLKEKEDYKLILSLLEDKFNFKIDKSNTKALKVFSESTEENKEHYMITLPSLDNKSAIEIDIFNNEEESNTRVFGRGKKENNKEKLYIIQNQEIEEIDSLDSNFEEEDNGDSISIQDWGDTGCLPAPRNPQFPTIPVLYNHCGSGCGDAYSLGGGSPINSMDICCRAHDRCWANFGSGDCECNAELVSCSSQYSSVDPQTATGIRAYFGGSRSC